MRPTRPILIALGLAACVAASVRAAPLAAARPRKTEVAIQGDAFRINGRPTYAGRRWRGHSIEGLLLNARMVQGIFDDLEPRTRSLLGLPRHRALGSRSGTPGSSSPPCPSWRRHGLARLHDQPPGRQPPGLHQGTPALAQLGARRAGRAAARLHGPPGAHPRPRRRAGHGRHPGDLLLRPGRAPGRTKPP